MPADERIYALRGRSSGSGPGELTNIEVAPCRGPRNDEEVGFWPHCATCTSDQVLVGPQSYLTGCTVEDEVFLATGWVFNGAHIGTRAEVRINAVVHLRTVLPADAMVPIGWVAVGDPARILPPDQHEAIWAVQKDLDFPGYVFGLDRPVDGQSLMPALTERFGRALGRHRDDRTAGEASAANGEASPS
nr:hypothetical protein KitaXyl93_11920 [Kitasatospora sp. Xyl93]